MARTLPTTVIQAANAQETDKVWLALLEIVPSGGSTIRIVNNTEDVTVGGDVYTAFPFLVTLPPDQEEAVPAIEITVVNTSRLLMSTIRTALSNRNRITVTLNIVEAGDPNTDLLTFPSLELVNVTGDAERISFQITKEPFYNEPVCGDYFTPANAPGLF